MGKVIGGTFIFSNDPQRLADWYEHNLGLNFGGASHQRFVLQEPGSGRELDETFAIMQAKVALNNKIPEAEPDDMYGDQRFMLNLRVDDLGALLADLEAKGVRPIKRGDSPYGRFAWVRDPDGNRLELYQPLGGEEG